MSVGRNIKRLRLEAGISALRAFAERLGVLDAQLSDWENDRYVVLRARRREGVRPPRGHDEHDQHDGAHRAGSAPVHGRCDARAAEGSGPLGRRLAQPGNGPPRVRHGAVASQGRNRDRRDRTGPARRAGACRRRSLLAPTDYAGLYAAWNVDGDGAADDPWDFGTSAVSGAVAGRGQRRSGELAGDGASTPRRPGADCGGGRPGAGGSHLHRVGAHDGTARCSHSAAVTRRPGRGQGDQGARDVQRRRGDGRGSTRCAEARACRRTAGWTRRCSPA